MRQLEQVREIWATDTLEPIGDFIEAADRAVVRYTWRGAGRGPESGMELTAVYTVRKRRVLFVEFSGITPRPSKPWGCERTRLTSEAG
jgi:hypothetical protein